MAAADFFLKLEGIDGESTDSKNKGWIDIYSFSWGMSQTGTHGTGGGGGAGKVSVHDISITKHVDKASSNLMLHCATGKHIKTGMITCRKAGGEQGVYLKITLDDILISGVQQGGQQGDVTVNENVTLNFGKFKVDYFQQGKDGGMTAAGSAIYSVSENKAG